MRFQNEHFLQFSPLETEQVFRFNDKSLRQGLYAMKVDPLLVTYLYYNDMALKNVVMLSSSKDYHTGQITHITDDASVIVDDKLIFLSKEI